MKITYLGESDDVLVWVDWLNRFFCGNISFLVETVEFSFLGDFNNICFLCGCGNICFLSGCGCKLEKWSV